MKKAIAVLLSALFFGPIPGQGMPASSEQIWPGRFAAKAGSRMPLIRVWVTGISCRPGPMVPTSATLTNTPAFSEVSPQFSRDGRKMHVPAIGRRREDRR